MAGVRVALVALLDLGVLDVVIGILVFEGVLGTFAGAFVLIGEEGSWGCGVDSGADEGGVSGDKGDGGSST